MLTLSKITAEERAKLIPGTSVIKRTCKIIFGVINCVHATVFGSMNVRTYNAVKYKCHTLSSATHIIANGPMTVQIGNAAKNKCNTLSSAVYITVELYICTCLR